MLTYDERVEKAVHILWVEKDIKRGQEAITLLEAAEAEGVADADYFLARVYAGPSYVDRSFGFPDEDEKVEEYLNRSIEKGSALGMFSARRFGGFTPRSGSLIQEPYHSVAEVWNEVCELAESGEIFAQYLVANAYFYGDVAELTGMNFKGQSEAQITAQFRQWTEQAIPMYEDLIAKGMNLAIGNLFDIFTSGDYGIPKNEKRAMELCYIGAERGDPVFMTKVADALKDSNPTEAAAWYQKAMDQNYVPAMAYLGRLYARNGQLGENLPKAKELLEACLEKGECTVTCHNRLGEMYFYGGAGLQADYAQAFSHLLAASKEQNDWGSDMLGTCYLKGLGTPVDYEKAKAKFQIYSGERLSAIGLGEIYAYGLGVPADIGRAMKYWDKFPDDPRVIENKKNFKKTLFGWKRIS